MANILSVGNYKNVFVANYKNMVPVLIVTGCGLCPQVPPFTQ